MRGTIRRLAAIVAVFALGGVSSDAQAADLPQEWRSPAVCGALDTPETGIQGDVPRVDQESGRANEGYNCGLAVVGHEGFEGVESSSLAWSGECAYVAGDEGVRVLDVRDAAAPTVVGTLDAVGGGSENIQARTTPERALLIATRGSGGGQGTGLTPTLALVDVFDIRECRSPRLLGTIEFPSGAHNIALNPDATEVWVTMQLQRADISDLADPGTWTVDNLQCAVLAQTNPIFSSSTPLCSVTSGNPQQLSHEVWFNADGTRLYIGGQLPTPYEEYVHVVDLTTSPPEVISSTPGAAHGIRRATIEGRPFLLHSDETAPGVPQPAERRSNGCVPEQATPFASTAESYLTDITDEAAPSTVARLGLAINRSEPELCAAAADSSVNSTVHYNTVDDPERTTFALLSMKNAGLRLFDVRDPDHPAEVAYFNPGQWQTADGSQTLDRVRMHSFYNASSGHIWMLSESGGFWVLELEPQVRTALGLAPVATAHPQGRPARPASGTAGGDVVLASRSTQIPTGDPFLWFCTT